MQQIEKLLIVDDDKASTFLIQDMLEEMQVARQIYTAHNGREALRIVRDACLVTQTGHCPELILLDINMPVMNGFEFLEELSQLEKHQLAHTRVFMLTSSANPLDVAKAGQYAVAGYIQKPLTEEKVRLLYQ